MIYFIYIICFIAGAGLSYFLLKSKYKQWSENLLSFITKLETGGGSANINSFKESGAPATLIEISNKFYDKLKSNGNQVISEPDESVSNQLAETKLKLNNTLIINELGQKITSSLLLSETFGYLFHTLNSLMDASIVELNISDVESGEIKVVSNEKGSDNITYENHISKWVVSNKRPVILADAENDFERYVSSPLITRQGKMAQSILCFPVLFHDEVSGTISIISFRKNAFESFHIEAIEHLLGFLSVAIQNAATHEQLNKLKIRAEESEKYEQQFLANMSHEIRTPMNAILGMTNLLLDTPTNPKQQKYLNAIKVSSQHLLVIINDILDLSKLEAGKMEIEKIPFRIRDVVHNVSDTNRYKAEEKSLLFEINISPDLPDVVKGDPTRLNQILTNLCSNAIKFTEKGRITLAVDKQADDKFIRFRVIDTGIGIPEDKLHLLFSNFKQVDSSTFRKYGGTGLGLSISKTLIELQGGKVDVNSKLGKGSEFIVSIPYDLGSEEEVLSIENSIGNDYSALRGINILVAEDNEYNQIVLNDTLESLIQDVKIEIAENGLLALECMRKNNYDLILMDAHMPEMDGLEATRQIRKLTDPVKNSIPIIALTASVHRAEVDKCFQSGMNDFVPKPFTHDELLSAMAKYYKNTEPVPAGDTANELQPQLKSEELNEAMEDNTDSDVTSLDFLREFSSGNPDRMKKYIGLYLKLLPDNLNKIQQAIDAKDFEGLVKVIHSMRPHMNYMGMKKAGEWASEIESSIRNEERDLIVFEKAGFVKEHCILSQDELKNKMENIS